MAVIVTADGERITAEDVWEWCRGRVPGFAIPRFVRFRPDLPLTPSEKIRRNVLRDEVAVADEVFDREATAAEG